MTTPRTEAGPYLAGDLDNGKFVRSWYIDVLESSKKNPAVVLVARDRLPVDPDNPSLPPAELVAAAFKELHKHMDKGNTP